MMYGPIAARAQVSRARARAAAATRRVKAGTAAGVVGLLTVLAAPTGSPATAVGAVLIGVAVLMILAGMIALVRR